MEKKHKRLMRGKLGRAGWGTLSASLLIDARTLTLVSVMAAMTAVTVEHTVQAQRRTRYFIPAQAG